MTGTILTDVDVSVGGPSGSSSGGSGSTDQSAQTAKQMFDSKKVSVSLMGNVVKFVVTETGETVYVSAHSGRAAIQAFNNR